MKPPKNDHEKDSHWITSSSHRSLFRLRRHVVAVLFCLVVTALYSQTTDLSNSSSPTFQSKVHLVVVDVTVIDKNGVPVTGLRKDDFRVLEERQPQTIATFEEHKGVPLATTEPPPFAMPLPQNSYTNYPLHKPADSVNVLLLDALNTEMGDQAYVHKAVVDYLKNLQPGHRLAIFTLISRLRMVEGFSTDPATLMAALNNKKFGGGPQSSTLLPTAGDQDAQQRFLNNMVLPGNTSNQGSIDALQQFLNEQTQSQHASRIKITLDALQQLARYLAGFPGRKNVIWFAGSFPSWDALRGEGNDELQIDIRKTVNMLAAGQVALYPVGAQGAEIDSLYDVETRFQTGVQDPRMPQQGAATDFQNQRLHNDRDLRILNHTGMDDLAINTGGRSFHDTNGLAEAMSEAVRDGSRYYTISYAPTDKRTDGRYRNIHVELTKGHYKLSYRRGYFADDGKESQQARMQIASENPLQSLMGRGMPDSTQIIFKVNVEPTELQSPAQPAIAGDNAKFKGPAIRYGVDFDINAKDLNLLPGPDGNFKGALHVSLVAYDHDGDELNWMRRRIELDYSPERFAAIKESGIPLHLEIDAPKGDVYLRAGIYEASSNSAGTIEIPLNNVIPPSETVLLSARLVPSPRLENKEPIAEGKSNPSGEMKSGQALEVKAAPVSLESTDLPARIGPVPAIQKLPQVETDAQIAAYCTKTMASQEHADALENVCEYALSLRRKLPDVIGDRMMKRHWRSDANWIKSSEHNDTVTSKVVYRNGLEYYDDLRVDGKSADLNSRKWVGAIWSSGEFANSLPLIFTPQSAAQFQFEKQDTFHSTPALIFKFEVAKQNNKAYVLHVERTDGSSWIWFPAYHGRIWIDARTGQLLMFERATADMPGSPIELAETEIDYADIALGDGSSFVLPTNSDALTCMGRDEEENECRHNVITFTNWQKFRAKTKILTDTADAGPTK